MSTLWILGEAKSGKSELGEAIFHRLPGRKMYVGTLPKTPETAEQIRKHELRRPKEWEVIEVSDDLSRATRAIGAARRKAAVAVLLDGFAVYLEQRAREWEHAHSGLSLAAEAPFIEEVCQEYLALSDACAYLIVVDHVSAEPPTALDYKHDRMRWRVREVVTRCLEGADHVVYHDRADVSENDAGFVAQVARLLVEY